MSLSFCFFFVVVINVYWILVDRYQVDNILLQFSKKFTVIYFYCLRFYIGCDMCANWFHGSCVQISPDVARSMDEWTCAECAQARRGVEEEELYCLCRQPYDEKK